MSIAIRIARRAASTGFIDGPLSRRIQLTVGCASMMIGALSGIWVSVAYGAILMAVAVLWPSPRTVRALESASDRI